MVHQKEPKGHSKYKSKEYHQLFFKIHTDEERSGVIGL